MFITIWEPGKDGAGATRLGFTRLQRDALGAVPSGWGSSIARRHGIAGIRTRTKYAADTRAMFFHLKQWIGQTGYGAVIETNAAEANALLAGGYVSSTGGTYRLQVREGRVNTLTGHGSVG